MQEKQEPVEKFQSQLTKLEHKINKHIKTIEHILQYPSDDDEQEQQANLAELDHNSRLIGKQIVKLKKQIDDALYQFQITSANTGQLNVRYNILRQSRKEVYQHNNQLKHKLQNGREKLKRLKKLSHTLSALQNEHSIEKTSVNKLQQAYNSAIKLQKQMEYKVQQLSNKQQNIIYELQHQRDKDIQISQFWKTRQKYDKLVNHKNLIHKHIQSRVHESNKIYSNKSKELEYVNNKINNYVEVFHQLEVTTNQQNFIIKEIMLREGLTAQQLLQQVNVQYGEQFLLQEDFNKIKDEDYLKNQIKKFKRKIGTQASSTQKISQIGSRKGRETSNYNKKIINLVNQLNSLADSQVQNKTQQLLNELKRIDQIFMKHHKIQWKGHIAFTRHGQCKNWSEKTFGMNPNAALSQQAVASMKNTHKYTKGIMFYPEQIPIIRISPLIRAKQTAKLLIPQNQSYNIKTEICLTENSGYPSGTLIRSKEQLKQKSQKASFFTNPTRALTYTIAELIYSRQSIFNKIEQVSSQIDKALLNLCQQENKSELLMSLNEKKEQLQKKQKVRCIKQIIEKNLQLRECDIWFFGHNNNIKTFFSSLFDRNTSLEYGETRRIYKIKRDTHQFYFHPSYNFVIDQSNGRVRAKFTPESFKMNFKSSQ